MNISHKIYVLLIGISLFVSAFSADTSNTQSAHAPFIPNKRHMHEKKEIKKDPTAQKAPKRAARIHKKAEEKKSQKENVEKHDNRIRHHAKETKKTITSTSTTQKTSKHHTNIARHHKKEPEAKKETFFQKTWGKIKAFFSSKKTE